MKTIPQAGKMVRLTRGCVMDHNHKCRCDDFTPYEGYQALSLGGVYQDSYFCALLFRGQVVFMKKAHLEECEQC